MPHHIATTKLIKIKNKNHIATTKINLKIKIKIYSVYAKNLVNHIFLNKNV